MTEVWLRAALWLGLALAATLISIRLRIATALSEIVVGTVAQLLIGAFVGAALPGTTESWVTFLAFVSRRCSGSPTTSSIRRSTRIRSRQ